MFNWLSSARHRPPGDAPAPAIPLDNDAQPPAFLNAGLRSARSTTEIIGFLKGLLADSAVSESEVIALGSWLCANAESDEWPVGVIVDRVGRALQDGVLEPQELADLKEFFECVVGGPPDEAGNRPTKLALTQPPPAIQFPGRVFVLTGRFILGSRKYCESLVAERGGICHPRVTRKTGYLVIGGFSSRDWLETSFGRKIETAVQYASKGIPISIVDEQHWTRFV